MGTILYFFFKAIGGSTGPTLIGPTWNPIYHQSPNKRIEYRSPNTVIRHNKSN